MISIDKDGKVGYSWTKDKLGMYHGEARIGCEPKLFWSLAK